MDCWHQSQLTSDVKLDPEVERHVGAVLTFLRLVAGGGSDLLPDKLLRVDPPHDVGRVAVGHRAAGVVENEAEVFPLPELEVVEDQVEEAAPFRLLVDVENVARVVEKQNLKRDQKTL